MHGKVRMGGQELDSGSQGMEGVSLGPAGTTGLGLA